MEMNAAFSFVHNIFLNLIANSSVNYELLGLVIGIAAFFIPSSLQLVSNLKENSRNSQSKKDRFYKEKLIPIIPNSTVVNFTRFLLIFSVILITPKFFQKTNILQCMEDSSRLCLEALYVVLVALCFILTIWATWKFCDIIHLYSCSNSKMLDSIKKDIENLLKDE